jgi:hypothetical protein
MCSLKRTFPVPRKKGRHGESEIGCGRVKPKTSNERNEIMLSTTFPGISANTPELLVPLIIIAAPFLISAIVGIGIYLRDWFSGRG